MQKLNTFKNTIINFPIASRWGPHIYIVFIFLFLWITGTLFHLSPIYAQYVNYPIYELGNCQSQRECELYCEIPKNAPACWSYGKYVMNQSEDVLGETTTATLTYPIAELGKCASATTCFAYCNQPKNQTACFNFAKSKGLVKESAQDLQMQEVVEAAKTELGCNSKDACMALCSQSANFDKCRTFGQKYNLTKNKPPENQPLTEEVMTAAKSELGCDGQDTCAAFCQNAQNLEKCKSFAEKYSLAATLVKAKTVTPVQLTPTKILLSCKTEAECKAYCEKYPNECPGFTKGVTPIQNQPTLPPNFKIPPTLAPTVVQ